MTICVLLPETDLTRRLEDIFDDIGELNHKICSNEAVSDETVAGIKTKWAQATAELLFEIVPKIVEVVDALVGKPVDSFDGQELTIYSDGDIGFDGGQSALEALSQLPGIIAELDHGEFSSFANKLCKNDKIRFSPILETYHVNEEQAKRVGLEAERFSDLMIEAGEIGPQLTKYAHWLRDVVAKEGASPGPAFGG